MRFTITIFWLVSALCSAFASSSPEQSLIDRVRNADVIALVSISNATVTVYTNAAGVRISRLACVATVQRAFKGTPLKRIQIKGETEAPGLLLDFPHNPRLLVFLKRSTDFYTPSDSYGLVVV